MRHTRSLLVYALAALCCSLCRAAEVTLLEKSPARYFHVRDGQGALETLPDLTAIVTSLLNVGPLVRVDETLSQQVATTLRVSPFDAPEGVVLFTVLGAPSGLPSIAGSSKTFSSVADSQLVGSLRNLANAPGLEHTQLNAESLSGCGELCLESMVQEALSDIALDANYTPASANLRGKLQIRSKAGVGTLDLRALPDRLFAIELISTWKATANAAADKSSRTAHGASDSLPQLIERTFLSLQALRATYGADSAQLNAGWTALSALIESSVQKLSTSFNKRIAFVLISLDEGGNGDFGGSPGGTLRSGKPGIARSLLETKGDSPAYTDNFIAWIAMWCTFFLLLFFAIAGCHCLKTMRFKQDSLLYGKNKAD